MYHKQHTLFSLKIVIMIYSSGLKQRSAVEYLNKQHRYISDKCPLLWWKANEHNFPNLGRHARCLLAIPATCVPSDRVFNTAGNIICSQ